MPGTKLRWFAALGLCGFCSGVPAAQVCNDAIPATVPDSRYRYNGNGTVSDLATGLTWKQCVEGLSGVDCTTGSPSTFTWQQALRHAADHVFADSSQWRLPNKNELASLVERSCYDPAVNSRFFLRTPSALLWSSSPYVSSWDRVRTVDFRYGHVESSYTGEQLYVRLVRTAQ